MRNNDRAFFITPRVVRGLSKLVLVFIACVMMSACAAGDYESFDEADGSLAPSPDLGELTATEKIFYTDSYAGYLVVFLKGAWGDGRASAAKSYPATTRYTSAVDSIKEVLARSYPTATIERSVTTDPARLDARRAELEQLSGMRLADFNGIYHVAIEKADEAVKLMRDLNALSTVDFAYPKLKLEPMTLANTPSLVQHQGYLYPESTHGGLNAMAAWNAGVRGENVILVDGDTAWNENHEDIDFGANFMITAPICPLTSTDPVCPYSISHGTAMAGIMAARDNGHGITGMAPNVMLHGASLAPGGLGSYLVMMTDGEGTALYEELPPSSIFTIIVGMKGPNTPGQTCFNTPYGCLPVEVAPDNFAGIQYAIAAGITIVTGAANGEQNLDNSSSYWSWGVNLAQNDSGSILVGASNGAAKQKAWFTNYGSPIDVFAWGENVATTGYPIPSEPNWNWLGTTPPMPPLPMDTNAFFVDVAAGTSPATAQIGAAAALVQSHAKQVMGQTRYIMPLKMREILVQSGVAQVGGGGNIGRQPRIDQAMALANAAWSSWAAQYPKLVSNQQLTFAEQVALRASGLGLLCYADNPAASDPSCADDALFTPGSGIAKPLDFDGDGRADLVSWKPGQFKIDLSSVGDTVDKFGAWDVVINYPAIAGSVVWPYVEDMNSDGRTDLVLYDKTNGRWYIAYMTSSMLGGAGFQGWDHVIQTNVHDQPHSDPWQTQYCRPHPGDYNGDGWVDLAVACSDGVWYIAHSGGVNWPVNVAYNQEVSYLTSQQLTEAPGWAYMTSVRNFNNDGGASALVFKSPDGVTDAGRVFVLTAPTFSINIVRNIPAMFGGNEQVLFLGEFTLAEYYSSIGIKGNDGLWRVADPDLYTTLAAPQPEDIYGGVSCHPIVADFDGDGKDDRTVMCPDGWRIAYTGNNYPQFRDINGGMNYRPVDLGYDMNTFTLPGRSYAGGISYEQVQQLIALLQSQYPNQPIAIPVDMVSVAMCDLVGEAGQCY